MSPEFLYYVPGILLMSPEFFWYHVLVHGHAHSTYVAEQNLEPEACLEPIDHPLLEHFFAKFENGIYLRRETFN